MLSLSVLLLVVVNAPVGKSFRLLIGSSHQEFTALSPCRSPRSSCCQTTALHLSNKNPYNRRDPYKQQIPDYDELDALENKVRTSARSQLDVDRILRALDEKEPATLIRNDLMYENEVLQRTEAASSSSSQWQIAVAASLSTGGLTYIIIHNPILSVGLSGFVFVSALRNDDDSLSGALARILGRKTIQTVQASQPKLRALARAVVTGEEEIANLKRRIKELETELDELRSYKELRIRMDIALPNFTVAELSELAKQYGLPVGGTKSEILLRLSKVGAIEM
jgi:SAP domain